MSTFTTSQQIAALAQNVTNLQGAIQGFRYQGLLYSLFGNCCATGMDVTTDLYPTVSVTSSSIATSTKITLGTAPTIPLVTGAYVEIDGHSGSVPALNGLQGPITVLTTTTFTIPVNVSTGGTGGTCHQVSMILSLNGQAVGDSAHLNPNGNSPPIRPEQYWNNALVYGEVFLRDQVNVGTLTDTNLTVTTAPGTGYHRYDAVYAYVTSAGATLGIAVGTAVTNATTPTLPSIPQGTMILAQIDVEANVPAIISSNITDLRNFTGRLKGIQGNAGTGGVNGPATYMVDDGDEGPWGPPSSAVGPQGNPGAQGALGVTMAIPGDDGEDGLVVGLPGPQGNPGAQGAQGVQGLTGPANMPGMDGVDGDDGMHIPGGVGPQGPQGLTGAQGPLGFGPSGMDGVDGDDGMHIPGGYSGATGPTTYPGAGLAVSTGSAWDTSVTPSTSGNVLTSNGTAWTSATPSSGSKAADVQTFTSSGTWTKPSGFGAKARVLIQVWGGGGGGSQGGGGGGGYNYRWTDLSVLSATETVTIGSGGAGSLGGTSSAGGTSSVGTKCFAYGGGGSQGAVGGGGGGQLSAGNTFGNGASGDPSGHVSFFTTSTNLAIYYEGSAGGFYNASGSPSSVIDAQSGNYKGGGGYSYIAHPGNGGGGSVWGGGGGGGSAPVFTTNGAGGVSIYGGNGGAGTGTSATGGVGVQPSGGGGGSYSGTGGAGGDGKAILTVFDGA